MILLVVLCFKQKTAYEMRISDGSSDVCSSDLLDATPGQPRAEPVKRIQGVVMLKRTVRWSEYKVVGLLLLMAANAAATQGPSHLLQGIDFVAQPDDRSEDRRVGKEGVRTCRCGWSPCH